MEIIQQLHHLLDREANVYKTIRVTLMAHRNVSINKLLNTFKIIITNTFFVVLQFYQSIQNG